MKAHLHRKTVNVGESSSSGTLKARRTQARERRTLRPFRSPIPASVRRNASPTSSRRGPAASSSRYLRTVQTAAPLSRRHPGVPVEQWPVEEFTYLDTAACDGTSYAERKGLRDVYWRRCEPMWVDGPGCECFADFIERVRHFEQTLSVQDADKSVV